MTNNNYGEKHVGFFSLKRYPAICLFLLFCILFCGCYVDEYKSSERKQLILDGEKIFKEYLARTDPKAKITEMKEIPYLGENHQFQLTELAEGTYESGGKNFAFAVNTKTGDIFTSERLDEFKEKLTGHINRRFDLRWTAVKADISLGFLTPLRPLNSKRRPIADGPLVLRGMLPAKIPDMDALVAGALENPDLELTFRAAFTGRPLRADSVTPDTVKAGSRSISVKLQRLPDALKAEVEDAARSAYGAKPGWPTNGQTCLAEESIELDKRGEVTTSVYRKWEDYTHNGNVPLTLRYPSCTRTCEKPGNAAVKTEEITVSPGTDLTIAENGTKLEFRVRGGKPIRFFVFLDDLSAVGNVKEIAVRNRKFHDAAYNESRWHPVLGRWAVGSKEERLNHIESLQHDDLIVVGPAAFEMLRAKKKDAEKK